MTELEQLKRQQKIAQQIIDVIDSDQLPAIKQIRLEQLNLKLDSLNRAGFYSRKTAAPDEK